MYWFNAAFPPTCRAVVEHAQRIQAVDLAYPIILSADGHVMDGMHRVAKAWMLGQSTITAVLVSADGAVAEGGYLWAPPLDGGFTVLELSSRDEAVAWAARIAKACRCAQELRVFQFDPQS